MMNRLPNLALASAVLCLMPLGTPIAHSAELLSEIKGFRFIPPKDGIPDNTTGGASRHANRCRNQESGTTASDITLLAPSSFIGLTISGHPDFFLYAEDTLAQQVFISIENELGETMHAGYQSLPTDKGLIKLELPDHMPSLIPDRIYKVTILPVCEEVLRPDDPALVAYVKRISQIESAPSMSSESAFEEARIYAESGIWYDTLVLLEQTLRDEPLRINPHANAAWNTLLSIGELTQFDLTMPFYP